MILLYAALISVSAVIHPDSAIDQATGQLCNDPPKVVLHPSAAIIDSVTGNLEQLPNDTELRPTEAQYRPLAVIRIKSNGYGFVNDVKFVKSSGNRRVDLAVRAWTYGHRFEERACNGSTDYSLDLQVELKAQGGT